MTAVSHYENFPVASWLCPAHLRPGVVALYHFARTADDLADEGDATAEARLDALRRYRQLLMQALVEGAVSSEAADWPHVFGPLTRAHALHQWPLHLLTDLLDAFEEDVRRTDAGTRYAAYADLLAYCAHSANPVGRLLLHMQGITDADLLTQSDAICTALQLINFWQDLKQDLARGRHYLPTDVLATHGLTSDAPTHLSEHSRQAQEMMKALVSKARQTMLDGAPLVHHVPGRFGWELRAVVQGGLRVCDRMAATDHRCWLHRPKLRGVDGLFILGRMLTMHA